jgi:hypothetical protein
MGRHQICIPLVASFILICATPQQARAAAKSPLQLCDALAAASQHNGKTILVEGLYMRVFHGSILSAPGCTAVEHPEVDLRTSPTFHGSKTDLAVLNKLTAKGGPVDVVLMGTLRVARKGQCFGQTCQPYEIVVSKLLRPSPVKGDNRSHWQREPAR